MSKKITLVLAVVVFICSAVISYSFSNNPDGSAPAADKSPVVVDSNSPDADKEDTSGPRTEACPMNGTLYTNGQKSKWENRRPLLVAIENHTESRPQSGLQKADVVYEAVAEGGITRFLAVYYCQDAKPIGPIRSARIYFLTLVQGYGGHPLYAHVGGANTPGPADALGVIQDLGWEAYNDMNQFAVPFPYYYRDYERLPNRATEHTMYSSTPKLWEYAGKQRKLTEVDSKGARWNADWTPWKFADEAGLGSRGSSSVDYGFWSTLDADNYKVAWKYDKETNSYARSNGGSPHIDKNTGKPITVKNVVITFADESVANDGYDAGQHLLYEIVGAGTGLVFQNGKSEKVTWKKPKEEEMTRFYDSTGKEVTFVRGPIWVSILPTGNKVNY